MIQIIPVKERTKQMVDTDKIFYIENGKKKNSMAEKYNWAIENIILKQNDENICFRHLDTEIRTPLDVCEYKLNNLFKNGTVGVAGLIGTINLENSCTWWAPNRFSMNGLTINGSGFIIQGGVRPKTGPDGKPILNDKGEPETELFEYPMDDHPGVHDYLATIDGCCMFFPKHMFEQGLRFDTNLKEYHFYDADICLQILEKGKKVSTIDIIVKHQSSGIPSPNFNDLKNVFFKKWDKKVEGKWPINRLTKFVSDTENK